MSKLTLKANHYEQIDLSYRKDLLLPKVFDLNPRKVSVINLDNWSGYKVSSVQTKILKKILKPIMFTSYCFKSKKLISARL